MICLHLLLDNAYDPDVKASQLYIDQEYLKEKIGKEYLKEKIGMHLTLTFTDNGHGMTPEKIYKMLRFVCIVM